MGKNDYISHYGVSKMNGAPHGSGRYPLGSGQDSLQFVRKGNTKKTGFLKKYLKNDGTLNGKALRKGTKFATKINNYYKYQDPRRIYDVHFGDTPKAKKKEEKLRNSIKKKQDEERSGLAVELDEDKVLSRYNKNSETFHKLRNARLEVSQRRQQVGDDAVQILKNDSVVPIPVAAIFASYGVQRILSDEVLNQKMSELETYKEQYRKETYDFLTKYTSNADINPIYLENMSREMTNFAANADKSSGDYTKKDLKRMRRENAKNLSRANPPSNV